MYAEALPRTYKPRYKPSSYKDRERRNRFFIHIILLALSLALILPLWLVISISFSDENDIAKYGFSLLPRHFTTYAYQYIFADPSLIVQAYGVTITVTLVGTVVGLFLTALLAYTLSRRDFKLRKILSFLVFFTLLFNGGLVPSYILVTQYLQLRNSLLALILPSMVGPWFVLLLRSYFSSLPQELIDAAKIDGASEWRIFFQMVIPLSTPALATIGLFLMLAYWNDWFLALLYIDDQSLFPLQYLLYQLSTSIDFLATNQTAATLHMTIPVQSVRMAMVVIATGPIVFAFLFLQRYFVRGITLGGLKGD